MSIVAASGWAQASTDSIESEGVRFGTGASIGTITEKMRITRGGLVGVGTQSPTATLQVSGSFIVSTSAQTTTPSLYVGANGLVGIGTSNPVAPLHIDRSGYLQKWSLANVLDPNLMLWGTDNASDPGPRLSFLTSGTAFEIFDQDAGGGTRVFVTSSTGLVGIGKTSPIAKLDVVGTISASDAIQVGTSSLTCSSAVKGAMRYSTTSSTLEYCNSTTWLSMGPSATSVPAFSVNKTSNQTVTADTWTLVTWNSENFDTNNNFASNRFTPTVPGKYLVTAGTYCNSTTGCNIALYKNGSWYRQNHDAGSSGMPVMTAIVDMNGTTDYLEIYGYVPANNTIVGASGVSRFEGILISMAGGSSGGGGATPAGSTGDIQFNTAGALAADTGQLFWDATNNRLGIGTGTPTVALHVVGDIAYTGVMSDVSDRRMKRNITTLGDSVAERLMLLKPVTFRMKDAEDTEYGFIAQDVQQVFPELVREGEILSLNYVGLIAPAVKTIQLLKRENEEQGDRIDALAEQNRLLRLQVKELMLETRKTQREVERLMGAVH